jgi:tetratricopeptide (TPR) repeat protein
LLAEFEARLAQESGKGRSPVLLAMAGLAEEAGRFDDALLRYGEAAKLDPQGTLAPLAEARLLERRGDRPAALKKFEAVLPKLKGPERELALRDLIRLCLDTKDFDGAERHHRELVRLAQGSMYVRAELGRELLQRGETARAIQELRAVVQAAGGDNRALAPALRDLGAALLSGGEAREAMGVLRRARATASGQPGLQREVDELLVDAYRREGRLGELVAEFEKSGGQDFDRLRTLGRLHEETGAVDKALGAYRRALTLRKQDVEVRLKVVQLLELQGELDAAIGEYEQLVQANPSDAPLVFRFAETLLSRGERSRALAQLERLERASGGDEDVLVALTDFYERVGESERAGKVLSRLSATAVRDPRHLVELGSRHWRDGKRDDAKRTWQRLLTAQPDRARALVTLGEVYLDHDLTEEALSALREAVTLRPEDLRTRRSLAIALERVSASASPKERNAYAEEARTTWQTLLDAAARDGSGPSQALARESRQHIVKLWQRTGQLRARLSPLAARLRATPPDLEAGRLLAEAELHLRSYANAEKTLRLVIREAPGDVASLLALERSLVAQEKRDEAIDVLAKLITADPQKAREYYQRSARYAAEQYQDDRAIQFAVRAVELSPDDAEGHLRLGEMYRRRQSTDLAIASFRQAIAKNERLYPAYFDLAELLVGQGQEEEADRWLRRVVRSAPDDAFVARAARLSLQLNLSRGSLAPLEADLLPLALGRPGKPLYRRLLIEVYSTEAFPLVHRLGSSERTERQEAAEQLSRLGERAVKPLLDALGDERPEQQRTALELLRHVRVRGASPALLAYAAGNAPTELRERAVIAAGASRDERSLPRLESLVFDGARARVDPVALAAAWAIARMEGDAAAVIRQRLITSAVPELRTLGLLGTLRAALPPGAHGGATQRATGSGVDGARRKLLDELAAAAGTAESGPWPRAAAAYGLGLLGAGTSSAGVRSSAGVQYQTLVGLLDSAEPLVQAHALAALARLGDPAVTPALAEALTSTDAALRSAALRAGALYAAGAAAPATHDLLEAPPEGRVDVVKLLQDLLPPQPSPQAALQGFVRLREPLEEAALLGIRSSGTRAVAIAQALTARDGAPAFGPLTDALDAPEGTIPAELRAEAERAAAALTTRVGPAFEALVDHESAEVRSASVAALGLLAERPSAHAAVLAALRDPAPAVQNAALTALSRSSHGSAPKELVALLHPTNEWSLRHGAAQALGRWLTRHPSHRERPAVQAALESARAKDPLAIVRRAAGQALESRAESPPRGALDRRDVSPVK